MTADADTAIKDDSAGDLGPLTDLDAVSAALDNGRDSIFFTDLDGTIEYVNKVFEKITGYSRAEAIGKPASMLDPPGQPQEFQEELWQTIRAGHVFRGEFTNAKKNGELYVEAKTITPIKTARGEITRFVTTGRDRTGFNRARFDQRKLASVVEATPDFVIISSPGEDSVYVNAAARERLGLGDSPMTRETISTVFADWAWRELLEVGAPAALEHGSWAGEGALLSPEGLEVPVSQILLVSSDEDGKVEFTAGILREITVQKDHERDLLHAATHDTLTGALNRRGLMSLLSNHFALARATGGSAALLLLDLDDFKPVNDNLGHAAGDEILVGLAAALQDWTGGNVQPARLGGDEFAVVLPDCDASLAERVAGDILTGLRQKIFSGSGHSVSLSGSIGVALMPDHGDTPDEILGSADLAMYDAKAAGRNRSVMFQRSHRDNLIRNSPLEIKDYLIEAIKNDSFVLFAQPTVGLSSGELAAVELLARLPGPKSALLAPDRFLKIAEQSGLTNELELAVIRTAIGHLADPRLAATGLRVHVNLSPMVFDNAGLPALVANLAAAASIDLRGLVLEITETAAISSLPKAVDIMNGLRELGCSFALDDFGVGYASLQHLKRLPLEFVKIDGEFIRDLKHDSADYHIVQATCLAANKLGIKVIAEYINSADAVAMLTSLGVEYGQGYYLGQPEPVAEFLAGLAQAA